MQEMAENLLGDRAIERIRGKKYGLDFVSGHRGAVARSSAPAPVRCGYSTSLSPNTFACFSTHVSRAV